MSNENINNIKELSLDKTTSLLVIIAEFKNVVEANIARGKLEAAGIYCILENEQTSSLWPGQFVEVKLKVFREDVERAREIL